MSFIFQLNLPILTVILPFVLALMINIVINKNWEQEKQFRVMMVLIFIGIALMSSFLGSMLFSILKGEIIETVFWPQMIPFELSFQIDGFSITMAILSFIIWFTVFIYSLGYIKKNIRRYYSLLILALGAVQDTFFAIDLVNFYIFLEITTIVTYFLIIHNKDLTAVKAGYKYLLMSLGGAFLVLLSILFAYNYTGNYAMPSIITCGYPVVPLLFLAGCFIKAGAVPFHIWLPDAHPAAPSPVSAFLSGIMIKIGTYGIIRVVTPLIEFDLLINNIGNLLSVSIVVIGIISMLVGVALALVQTDVKRLLAYHSISQIGYILLGIGLGTQIGLVGAIYHTINHATFKSLLFMGMGAVIFRTGSKKLDDFGDLWRKMPITTATCIVAALSISGIPPFNGFASKMLLGKSVSEFSVLLKNLMTIASAFTFASFFKLISFTFFGKEKKAMDSVDEAPIAMLLPIISLSVMCIILGLQADTVMEAIITVTIIQPEQLLFLSNIKFWNIGMVNDSLVTIVLGTTFYSIALKFGLFSKKGKINRYSGKTAKGLDCLSINSFYCYLATLLENSCQKLNKIHSRDPNMHLSWIVLTIVILYLILFVNIFYPSLPNL